MALVAKKWVEDGFMYHEDEVGFEVVSFPTISLTIGGASLGLSQVRRPEIRYLVHAVCKLSA